MIVVNMLMSFVLVLPTAAHDDNVEWSGVSHLSWLDRSPLCPVDGETFTIKFQTYRYDITSARVHVDDGIQTWVDADWSHAIQTYDVWTAEIPATAATSESYYIELTDGTQTDYLGPSGMSSTPPASGWELNFSTLTHAPQGGTLTSDGGAVFNTWAPNATSANVAGTFNSWNSGADPLTKIGDYFVGRVSPTVAANEQYKYVFNPGSDWSPDARGRAWNPGDNNNTFLIDPTAYVWDDRDFIIPPFEEMVVYELHVGTFSGNGDGLGRMGLYRDVVDTHLDHLLYLGVNAVELMPITEFDYYESWGYNPVNNWGPENAYGSPDDLKYMIDILHQNGIAVLMDIVYNHFSFGGNEMWCYDGGQVYFEGTCAGGACSTPWGDQAWFWKPEVRDYYADNVLYWLEEFHADGFRMDATSYMRDPLGCYSEGWDLMQRINDEIDNRKINAISIAEELPDNTSVTSPTSLSGAGFDSQWHDKFNDDVRQEIFDAAFGNPEMWKVRNAITDSAFSNKTHVVNYVESHDEAGGDGTGQDDERLAVTIDSGDPYSVYAKGRSKLAQGLTILAPGIPMFLQGGEWMEDIKFNSGSANRIDWTKATSRAAIVQFFHDVIAMRKSNCGLRSDAGYYAYHTDDTGNVIAFTRGDGQELVVVANFSNTNWYDSYNLDFPLGGTWYEILNSQALDYLGNGVGNGGSITTGGGPPYSASITIPEMGLLVFRHEDPPGRSADLNSDGHVDLYDYYLLQQEAGQAGCGLSADINEDGRINADDLAVMVDNLTGP